MIQKQLITSQVVISIKINDHIENWKWLAYSVWLQGLKDLKKNVKCNDRGILKDWLLNEGRMLYTPHISKSEAEVMINEYLSR